MLLRLQERAFEQPFYVSSITFQELEDIKSSAAKDAEIKYRARNLLRLFEKHDNYTICIATMRSWRYLNDAGYPATNDNLIIAGAALLQQDGNAVVFVTDDRACRMLAECHGLKTEILDEAEKEEYKGYREIRGDGEYITEYMSQATPSMWYPNEYLIIHNDSEDKPQEMRWDGQQFVALRLPPSGFIKAKNSLQRCALDLLANKDISTVAILGGYGSGKTHLAMQMALYHVTERGNQSRILGVREATGEGAQIGYLKGDFSEKTKRFFKPLEQQLKGGEFELEALMQRGALEVQIPYFMKGTTYNDTIMVIDEAEDLKESQIRLIGTRIGQNSRIFLAGDYKQSLISKNLDNPLVKACYELRGNPRFGCIVLDEDVRSETSKMFAELFQK